MTTPTPAALRAANQLKVLGHLTYGSMHDSCAKVIDEATGLTEINEGLKRIQSKLKFEAACNKQGGMGATFEMELGIIESILAKHSA